MEETSSTIKNTTQDRCSVRFCSADSNSKDQSIGESEGYIRSMSESSNENIADDLNKTDKNKILRPKTAALSRNANVDIDSSDESENNEFIDKEPKISIDATDHQSKTLSESDRIDNAMATIDSLVMDLNKDEAKMNTSNVYIKLKECFNLYDTQNDGLVPTSSLGNIMRSIGMPQHTCSIL